MLCEYGCGQESKFVLKNGKNCCSEYANSCPVIRKKNTEGLKLVHKTGKMRKFTEEDRTKSNEDRILKAIEKAFTKNSNYSNAYLKKYLLNHYKWEYKCKICGIDEWLGKKLILDLDHIDGDNKNNLLDNLRFLCPNCHSLTETFRGRNINTGKTKVSDELLLETLSVYKSIRKTLMTLGLSDGVGNYDRIKKLIKKHNINYDKKLTPPSTKKK